MRELRLRNAFAILSSFQFLEIILTFPSDSCYHIESHFDRVSSKKSRGMEEMKDREILIMFGAGIFILVCLTIMVFMHEQHYRKRRVIIDPDANIEDRISNIERILLEDRYT